MVLWPVSYTHLKDRSPFYAKKFEGIDLSDVQTQADFEALPFSEKADLRDAYPLGLAAVPESEIVRIHSSSGTTGTPVIIPYTQDVYKRQGCEGARQKIIDLKAEMANA